MDLLRRERDFLRALDPMSSKILRLDFITPRRSRSSERTVAIRKFPPTGGFMSCHAPVVLVGYSYQE
jgi:hypothetical protein